MAILYHNNPTIQPLNAYFQSFYRVHPPGARWAPMVPHWDTSTLLPRIYLLCLHWRHLPTKTHLENKSNSFVKFGVVSYHFLKLTGIEVDHQIDHQTPVWDHPETVCNGYIVFKRHPKKKPKNLHITDFSAMKKPRKTYTSKAIFLVEMVGVEPTSESISTWLSPSASDD